MKHTTAARRTACLLLLALAAAVPAPALSSFLLGAYGEGLVSAEQAAPAAVPAVRLGGLADWRTLLPGGYLALSASALGRAYLYALPVFSDQEDVEMELGLEAGPGRFKTQVNVAASALGDGSTAAYLRPDWQLGYQVVEGLVRPALFYRGSYLLEPAGSEDSLYQGLRLGLGLQPDIRHAFSLDLTAGWALWPETALYDASGALTGASRQDLSAALSAGAEGLAGYFLGWQVTASGGLLLSTANRYLTAVSSLEKGSQDNWFLAGEAGMTWSPHRTVDLELSGFARHESYLYRAALDSAAQPGGEPLRILSVGFNARADWTPDDRFYLVLEGSAARRFANDPAEARWNASIAGGLEVSF